MSLKRLLNSNYSLIFAVYDCDGCDANVFQNAQQESIKEVFTTLNLPTKSTYILPPFPFPSFDYELLFQEAIDKTDFGKSDNVIQRQLYSNILLASLKHPTTTTCSPIIFFEGKYQSDAFLYRMGEKPLSTFISKENLQQIAETLHLKNLRDLTLVDDNEQERHLRRV